MCFCDHPKSIVVLMVLRAVLLASRKIKYRIQVTRYSYLTYQAPEIQKCPEEIGLMFASLRVEVVYSGDQLQRSATLTQRKASIGRQASDPFGHVGNRQ
mmetsp:Transcript_118556/g.232860  ORF Transcript_118556/g.232860 Transcript_118556/m.232860 type:complete len:99 (+) Transcript_118556:1-297(+)